METQNPTNIWCTLVMLNDTYACGAAVVAHMLRKVGTKYPIWCMVADGVSRETEELLKGQFDNVVRTPLLEYPSVQLKSKKQNEIYGSWIHASYTKLNIFNPAYFPADKVNKIILLDADMMVKKNIDHLFDLDAPAMTFSSPWAHPYVKGKRFQGCKNFYGEMKHGQIVSRSNIIKSFNKSILGLACMVLVKPSAVAYDHAINLLNACDEYGNSSCVSGFDEQLFAEVVLAMNVPIRHIHQQYNWIVGKTDWLLNGEEPSTQQFYNGKPWLGVFDANSRKKIVDNSEWQDVRDWWVEADEIIAKRPDITCLFYMHKPRDIYDVL